MTHWPLLSLLVWLPILGGVFTMMAGNSRPRAARWIALAFAVASLLLCIPLFAGFDLGIDDEGTGVTLPEEHWPGIFPSVGISLEF